MGRIMGRRAFLARSAAVVTSLVAALTGLDVSAKRLPETVYLLDPSASPDDPSCGGCGACLACEKHAANKLFATHTAADMGRAHANCDCRIVTSTLDYAVWVRLFGPPRHITRNQVDRRWAWVQAVLGE